MDTPHQRWQALCCQLSVFWDISAIPCVYPVQVHIVLAFEADLVELTCLSSRCIIRYGLIQMYFGSMCLPSGTVDKVTCLFWTTLWLCCSILKTRWSKNIYWWAHQPRLSNQSTSDLRREEQMTVRRRRMGSGDLSAFYIIGGEQTQTEPWVVYLLFILLCIYIPRIFHSTLFQWSFMSDTQLTQESVGLRRSTFDLHAHMHSQAISSMGTMNARELLGMNICRVLW